jgi:V/A-type H+/Na+-transporting ATPase subunit E
MAEQIKELIQKIQAEGIQAAEVKAGEILREAKGKADVLIAKAETEAKRMIEDAEAKSSRLEASSRASLEQAARDMLLALRNNINEILQRVINAQLRTTLTSDELGKIIEALVRQYGAPEKAGVVITLSPQDKEKLEGLFINKLKDFCKRGITVQASNELQAGFIISFDAGRSQFDFSNQALVEFICANLKPNIAALLNAKN